MFARACFGSLVALAVLCLVAPAAASVIAYQVPVDQAVGVETCQPVADAGEYPGALLHREAFRAATHDGSRFKTLATPLELPAGFRATISASGYGGGERNGNHGNNPGSPPWTTDSGGGVLSFVGSSRWGDTPGVYPPNADGGPANRYAAGTFVYDFTFNDPTLDTTTQGDWIGVYGKHGYVLPAFDGGADLKKLPSYVDSISIGGARYTWTNPNPAGDVRALLDPADPGNTSARKATCTFDGTSLGLTVNLQEPQTFLMSFYLLDWDSTARRQSIDIFGYNPVDDGDFNGGHWYQYLVSGGPGNPVTAQFTQLAGANAVLSAVTFDPFIIPEPGTLLIWSLLAGLGAGMIWRRR